MPRIPIPPEMPKNYRVRYMANWIATLYKRPCPHPNFTGACVGCGIEGVIGSRNLTHRGDCRPTNLLCLTCNMDGEDIDEKEPEATAGKRRKKGASKNLEGRKPALVRGSRLHGIKRDRPVHHRNQTLSKD